ncbi:uncharacterized protein LOC135697870 [Ochlerotatus camptorhynchus]|uniref:uncharacterized protein LOC135697870 n=1 Tax=Ochlerotatus camptorhynchus TaxID=644619 RepID=UPI0031E07437
MGIKTYKKQKTPKRSEKEAASVKPKARKLYTNCCAENRCACLWTMNHTLNVNERLFGSCKNYISTCQHGFFPGRSVETNLVSFTSFCMENVSKKLQVDAIYTDLKVYTFDKVVHVILLAKLDKIGCSAPFCSWLRSYLVQRQVTVCIGNYSSYCFSNSSGVPQGSILGLLLFSLFVNDATFILPSGVEKKCEELFQRGVQRGPEDRYTVPLPKNEDVLPNLGESRDIAFRRLLGTERRLARDANLREQYIGFMDEYLKLGHMRKVEETAEGPVKRCYLPHHPVVKEASTTIKVRVVFDASCKTSSGVSLNDVLLVGPVVWEDLRSIILRSRMKQILLVSDVEKMFRQILTWLKDRPLQTVLFRFSPDEEVAVYELNTVTYGTKPAPFLATRTLRQLAADEEDRFPLAARAIREDVYMDDVITRTDEVDAAISLRNQLPEMMLCGGFKLRKWACNVPEVLEGVPEENLALRDPKGINLDSDQSVKTLGLTWMPITDTLRFQFTVPPIEPGVPLTKRRILSLIATLFDPLGLIGATTSSAKIFMQQLWTLQDETGNRLDWDQPVPLMVGENWLKFHEELPLLNEIRVDRCVMIPKAVLVEIHCFSDASNKAYGGCVYIRSQDSSGTIKSIPRLELCGALLSAQLYEKVKDSTRLAVQTFFWTDLTCVLRWIESTPATWTTFVANRVAKIQTLTEGWQWRHVPGTDNPADLISRGVSPEDIDNELWWEGPNWLKEAPEAWPGAVEEIPEA